MNYFSGGDIDIPVGTDARRADESLIREALLRELKLYEARERLAVEEIADLERKHGMRSDELFLKFAFEQTAKCERDWAPKNRHVILENNPDLGGRIIRFVYGDEK